LLKIAIENVKVFDSAKFRNPTTLVLISGINTNANTTNAMTIYRTSLEQAPQVPSAASEHYWLPRRLGYP
jgi:hypothetical protein